MVRSGSVEHRVTARSSIFLPTMFGECRKYAQKRYEKQHHFTVDHRITEAGSDCFHGCHSQRAGSGLALNKANLITDDYTAADAAVLAYQTELANRVAKVAALDTAQADARKWFFRAKDALKPFLGDSHNMSVAPHGLYHFAARPGRLRRVAGARGQTGQVSGSSPRADQ